METVINLIDLLKHEIMDLYSAEEQIIEALPAMIDKAKNADLKQALRQHLKITEDQKSRLDKVKTHFGEGDEQEGSEEKKGFFSKLFGGGGEKCKGMEGLITEGNKMMKADISEEALDAAIIASAQKIEHYEISGYGTARAFARQLNLTDVEMLLTETLNEEYEADDRLTDLAVGKLNPEADGMEMSSGRRSRSKSSSAANNSKSSNSLSKNSGPSKSAGKSSASKSSNQPNASKNNSKTSTKGGGSKSSANKSGNSKNTSKGSSKSQGKSGGIKGDNSSKGNSKGSSKSSKSSSSKGGSSKGGSSKNKVGRKR